uniref:Uncharacterized protein MANES_09G071900 n=2 Tax=Rhizophora mucronata TaxID=61149 RepID=A0A2P2K3B7_RHIMU
MSLLIRYAARSNLSSGIFAPAHGRPFFLRESPKWFSTEAEQPPAQPSTPPSEDSPIDPFLQNSSPGLMYGRLFGIMKHTLKSDIINMLEGSDLTVDDIKISYSQQFIPFKMLLQFPSRQAFDNAARMVAKKGRLYRLERADRSEWDILMPYDGKTVLLRGFPRNVAAIDIERFLSGCVYDPSSMEILRQGFPTALVRFPTRAAAMNAFITKNRGLCVNNRILMRVLE